MESNDSNLPEYLSQFLSETSEGQRFYERVKRRVLYGRTLSRKQGKELREALLAGWIMSILSAGDYKDEDERLNHFAEWAHSLKPIELPLVVDPDLQ